VFSLVLGSRKWQKVGLAANLAGAVLLWLSFQATSSNLKIVTTTDHRTALCAAGRALIVDDPLHGGTAFGVARCPEWENARPAAVVNVELPFLVTLGFILLLLGFAVQYFSIPNPETIEHLREELKLLRKLRKKQS
jgi:hypothetical protein